MMKIGMRINLQGNSVNSNDFSPSDEYVKNLSKRFFSTVNHWTCDKHAGC